MTATSDKKAKITTPSDTTILISREFDAPRHLVYRAYTEPDLIRRWWHANRSEVTSIEVDLRVGGKWRYDAKAFNGYEFSFYGEYREIVPNERLVSTETFSGVPDAAAVDTVTFTEKDGRTYLELLVEHQSKENRDGHLNSGMEDGLQDAFQLLEAAARELA